MWNGESNKATGQWDVGKEVHIKKKAGKRVI